MPPSSSLPTFHLTASPMNSENAMIGPSPLLFSGVLLQANEELQQESSNMQSSNQSIDHPTDCTLSYCGEGDKYEWPLEDDNSFNLVGLHSEVLPSWAVNEPLQPDLVCPDYTVVGLSWPNETNPSSMIEHGSCDQEAVEWSWSGVADFVDISLFGEDIPEALPSQIALAGQLFESSSDTAVDGDVFDSEMIGDTLHSTSDSAESSCGVSPPSSASDIRNSLAFTSPELHPSEFCRPSILPKEATKNVEIIDLTRDDMDASLELLNPEPTSQSSNGGFVERAISVIDLTQDDDEIFGSWYDNNCDDIDYHYRSPYENDYQDMASVRGFFYPSTASNFVTTGLLVNGKTYLWNHRCNQYKNRDSFAKPNHKDTTIVIRAGGSDIPIELTYRGFGIWEGSNYCIGVAISDDAAKSMVFKRQSLPLKKKRGCMYSKDLFHGKRE
ncbi:hypothetical protein E5D57_013798 [Metarhizium anisopliae]|nr:hypothetical protein E5D57_013798 [Metarhizium anisopliae]